MRGATFRLGDRLIFKQTTWTFRRDEHWAVLGDNGSGKSLLGDALRGRLPLVEGELIYHFGSSALGGRDERGEGSARELLLPEEAVGHVSFDERKQELHGTVLQSRWNSIEDESSLTVAEFLRYERVLEINPYEIREDGPARRMFTRRQRIAAALLGIERFQSRHLISLSNGERQRVELARVLSRPLRLLILDEPFTGLDARSRVELSGILERLMKTGLRVLLITTRAADLPRGITHVAEVENCAVRSTHPVRKLGSGAGATALELGKVSRSMREFKATKSPSTSRRLVLDMRDVTVRYGDAILLSGINWQVSEGESWALLGPNGSGKSTLLSLITGDNPQAFNNGIMVFGHRVGTAMSVWELKRRIGYISPELQVHFDANARCADVVASGFAGTIGLFESPAPRHGRLARRVLRELDLPDCADTPLFALSTGLQRVVLLARALVGAPRLLLLDEPCQGLDAAHRKLFIHRVDQVIRRGKTSVIYVTHRDDELPRGINKVLRLG